MNSWKRIELRRVLKIKHGFAFKGEFFSDSGTQILLTPGNFYEKGGFKYTSGKEKYYTADYPSEYLCTKGDLVVAMTEQAAGLLGSTAIVPDDDVFLHNQRIGLITFDKNEYDKLFLYYLFRTKSVRKQISLSSSGSKVKHTSPDRIYDVIVKIPDISVQRKIGHILFEIDTKIELNSKINKELEATTKTLYDYWFVQFDFPNDKGEPYRSIGGTMGYDEKLKMDIPRGWEMRKISSLYNFQKGTEPGSSEYQDSKETNNHILFHRVGDIYGGSTIYINSLNSDCNIIEESDVVVTFDGSVGKVGFGLKGAYSSGIQRIYDESGKFNNALAYSLFSDKRIIAIIHQYATGSIILHASGSIMHLIIPFKEDIYLKFQEIVTPIYSELVKNKKEIQQFTELRDWLLPMLMNGQVTVGEAEEQLNMAAEPSVNYKRN